MSAPISGAHSIFSFIERTAEKVPTGIRWQTIDYENKELLSNVVDVG